MFNQLTGPSPSRAAPFKHERKFPASWRLYLAENLIRRADDMLFEFFCILT